jgi:cysteinyl-tRNA synthetase
MTIGYSMILDKNHHAHPEETPLNVKKKEKASDQGLCLWDIKTKTIIPFEPHNKQCVFVYQCGPTVYDRLHVGNLRPWFVGDILIRLLKVLYPKVVWIRNITDVDDKIIERSQKNNRTPLDLTTVTTQHYQDLMCSTSVILPTLQPKASEHIADMIDMIQILLANDSAYVTKEGNVYLSLENQKNYGELSNQKEENHQVGVRIQNESDKKNPSDFCLWKKCTYQENQDTVAQKKNDKGPVTHQKDTPQIADQKYEKHKEGGSFTDTDRHDNSCCTINQDKEKNYLLWQSPWSLGRPGWHLECAAMIQALTPHQQVDIHMGGQDLLFPHHENENILTHLAHGHSIATYWMHNGLIQFEGSKMSKSLGNLIYAEDILNQYPRSVLRYFVTQTHYRQDLLWSEVKLGQAEKALKHFYLFMKPYWSEITKYQPKKSDYQTLIGEGWHLLCQDLNTGGIVALMHQLTQMHTKKNAQALWLYGYLLGLWTQDQKESELFLLRAIVRNIPEKEIENLLTERARFKKEKKYQEADHIRTTLTQSGIVIHDDKNGKTYWDYD